MKIFNWKRKQNIFFYSGHKKTKNFRGAIHFSLADIIIYNNSRDNGGGGEGGESMP